MKHMYSARLSYHLYESRGEGLTNNGKTKLSKTAQEASAMAGGPSGGGGVVDVR